MMTELFFIIGNPEIIGSTDVDIFWDNLPNNHVFFVTLVFSYTFYVDFFHVIYFHNSKSLPFSSVLCIWFS
jgi:hypothetical protein